MFGVFVTLSTVTAPSDLRQRRRIDNFIRCGQHSWSRDQDLFGNDD